MWRAATFVITIGSIARADPDPKPPEHGVIVGGILFGADAGGANGALTLEATAHVTGPWVVHAVVSRGATTDLDGGSGPYRRATAGIELRHCRWSGENYRTWACLFIDGDAGYETAKDGTPAIDHRGVLVGPRIGAQIEHGRFVVRETLELMAYHHVSEYIRGWSPASEMTLLAGYRF